VHEPDANDVNGKASDAAAALAAKVRTVDEGRLALTQRVRIPKIIATTMGHPEGDCLAALGNSRNGFVGTSGAGL